MNWTGGSLQRTKHANKGVVQKQKAYFAKAHTHLQNGPKSPAAPFRPTYLQNDSTFELAGHLPTFGSGSVRHTGHSVRRRHKPMQRKPSPDDHTFEYDGDPRAHPEDTRQIPSRGDALADRLPGSKPRDEQDLETQLLEANRKRLLRQRDWIGVAPSRPVNLHFMSSKEKSKVGRRRKVDGRHGAIARKRDEIDFMTQPFQPAGDQHAGAFIGDMKTNLNDIRIRIGTDALTTACSTERIEYDQSHASSDLMLFDQQAHDTEQPDTHETAQHGVQEVHQLEISTLSHDPANGGDHFVPARQARNDFSSPRIVADNALPDRAVTRNPRRMRQALPGFLDRSTPRGSVASEDIARALQITQQVEGIDQPLRLVFPGSISSGASHNGTTVHNHGLGGTVHAFEVYHAGKYKTGNMHHLDNAIESHSEGEAAPAVSIVDDKPWKSFKNIPDESSSHSATANDSERSVLHQHPTPKIHEAERTSWSQHATQGEQTHTSSSFISASLPSVKRDAQTRHSIHGPRTRANYVSHTSRQMNEDEQIWQTFVLGSNDTSSSLSTRKGQDGGQSITKGSSGYLPLSAAVSSISSPFRPTLGNDPGMRYDVHDAARFAPPGSRSITSPASMPVGFVEELSDEDEDEPKAESNVLGESVTHASLLANTSGDSDLLSSRMFSHSQTSRSGLEHPSHNGASFCARAQANCGGIGREREHASGYDIPKPDSEDEGLHLVDPDCLG